MQTSTEDFDNPVKYNKSYRFSFLLHSLTLQFYSNPKHVYSADNPQRLCRRKVPWNESIFNLANNSVCLHVMLAERIDIDFFHYNHIFAIFIEYGITNNIAYCLFITLCEENQCLEERHSNVRLNGNQSIRIALLQQHVSGFLTGLDREWQINHSNQQKIFFYLAELDLHQYFPKYPDNFG